MAAWIFLALAAVFEVIFAVSMKFSAGFTQIVPTTVSILGAVGGFIFLTLAMKSLPVSVAYPIWTACGTLGTLLFGYLLLGESASFLKLLSVALIVAGVAGLRATMA